MYNIEVNITNVFCFNFSLIKENIVLIRRAFTADFVIPDFSKLCETVDDIYWRCRTNTDGKVTTVISTSFIKTCMKQF